MGSRGGRDGIADGGRRIFDGRPGDHDVAAVEYSRLQLAAGLDIVPTDPLQGLPQQRPVPVAGARRHRSYGERRAEQRRPALSRQAGEIRSDRLGQAAIALTLALPLA